MLAKLTPEQKKLVWSQPASNAGVGWHSPNEHHIDGFTYELRGRAVKPTLLLDDYEHPNKRI